MLSSCPLVPRGELSRKNKYPFDPICFFGRCECYSSMLMACCIQQCVASSCRRLLAQRSGSVGENLENEYGDVFFLNLFDSNAFGQLL